MLCSGLMPDEIVWCTMKALLEARQPILFNLFSLTFAVDTRMDGIGKDNIKFVVKYFHVKKHAHLPRIFLIKK